MITIEKLQGGYIISTHDDRRVVTAEHLARLIHRHWPDVMHHIREIECETHDLHRWENEGGKPASS